MLKAGGCLRGAYYKNDTSKYSQSEPKVGVTWFSMADSVEGPGPRLLGKRRGSLPFYFVPHPLPVCKSASASGLFVTLFFSLACSRLVQETKESEETRDHSLVPSPFTLSLILPRLLYKGSYFVIFRFFLRHKSSAAT